MGRVDRWVFARGVSRWGVLGDLPWHACRYGGLDYVYAAVADVGVCGYISGRNNPYTAVGWAGTRTVRRGTSGLARVYAQLNRDHSTYAGRMRSGNAFNYRRQYFAKTIFGGARFTDG